MESMLPEQLELNFEIEAEVEGILDEHFLGGVVVSRTTAALASGNCRLIEEGELANKVAD